MPIRLQYILTFDDFVSAQKLHARRNWWRRLNLRAAYIVNPILGGLLIVLAFLIHGPGIGWGVVIFNVALGGFLASYPLIIRLRWKLCYRRTRQEPGECTIELDENLLRTQAAHMRSEVEWSAIRSFSEDKSVFLLYMAPARFIAVPKRVCSTEQIEQVRALCQAHIGAVPQLSSK